ncbi:hypothetical protein PR048_019745 [Dryococelus australis]|uniref:DDE-1 domain-containing protein n=1 Tax=Dryococelus australis TaxID=614101 RepID=A0ABQ9H4B1_9NEOP|nr:hypothetical protein PR048_019745 [Dryococelus australis]
MIRNNNIMPRKAGNISYCRLMRINKEIVSARFDFSNSWRKSQTETVLACTSATGTNWMPPTILYKGNNDLLNGTVFAMTTKWHITKEELCNFLRHFNSHRIPGKSLLIFDGHRSHVDNCVLDVSESLGIQLFCLPAHCSHELQPLDERFFNFLKLGSGQFPEEKSRKTTRETTVLKSPGHKQLPRNVLSGFRATGILRCDPHINPETACAPSDV